MIKKNQLALFIFRRDLRLDDNTGLLKALEESRFVIPSFIFDPRQINSSNNYRSLNCIQFMIESLQDLAQQLDSKGARLYLFSGHHEDIVKKLIENEKIDAVYLNQDYTPYSRQRDEKIENLCKANNIKFNAYHDALLNAPQAVKKNDGQPYTIFTPFYKKSSLIRIQNPEPNKHKNYYTKKLSLENYEIIEKLKKHHNENIFVHGGTKECLKILKNIDEFKNYQKTRDFPFLKTTGLSAHNKFGTISIRKIFQTIESNLGSSHMLLKQLYWRDFFTHIAYHFPHVFGNSFHEKFQNIPWSYDKENLETWCNGLTGFPIVDAGIRQLNTTGWMHNRVRMIAASFLTKNLHIDWQLGEKYFAQQLVDYDPAVNNGNWQWAASTGCDAQPYFRIFNPWLQQKKFDPDCEYIKTWIPELRSYTPNIIHNLHMAKIKIKNYPSPILDHKKEAALSKKIFKKSA